MFKYLVTISYDGNDFFGWAKQKKEFTAQGYIEEVISKSFNKEIKIKGISRLDRGVHAREQKFFFELDVDLEEDRVSVFLKKALRLVLIKEVQKLPQNFQVSWVSFAKEYRYFINTGEVDFWQRNYRWELSQPLSQDYLKKALQVFVGQHDFFNFCFCPFKKRNQVNTFRKIDSISVKVVKKILVVISIKGKGFLRYQIRAIIGEVVEHCLKSKPLQELRQKLTSQEELDKYKHLAPPQGLYLWKIKCELKEGAFNTLYSPKEKDKEKEPNNDEAPLQK